MTLRFAPQARRHLDAIADYIRQHNPNAARRVRAQIRATVNLLEDFPYIARAGTKEGTRELIVPQLPYVIVHRIEPNGDIVVVGIYHSAQLRPGQSEL